MKIRRIAFRLWLHDVTATFRDWYLQHKVAKMQKKADRYWKKYQKRKEEYRMAWGDVPGMLGIQKVTEAEIQWSIAEWELAVWEGRAEPGCWHLGVRSEKIERLRRERLLRVVA